MPTPTSPYTFYRASDVNGAEISGTVTFDAQGNLTGGSSFRDPTCVYTRIYVGVGPDGTPNSSPIVVTVPAGATSFTAAQLASIGLRTLSDVLNAPQLTAGP